MTSHQLPHAGPVVSGSAAGEPIGITGAAEFLPEQVLASDEVQDRVVGAAGINLPGGMFTQLTGIETGCCWSPGTRRGHTGTAQIVTGLPNHGSHNWCSARARTPVRVRR